MIVKPRPLRKLRKGHWATKVLVDFWPFYEGDGVIVQDSSENGNNGTFMGTAPSWTSGQFGSAVLLPGTDEYISPMRNFNISTTGNYSMSAWVKTSGTTLAGILERGIVKTGNKFYGTGLMFDISGDWAGAENKVWFCRNIGTNGGLEPIDALSTSDLNDGKWHFVVGVYDGVNVLLYFDGILEATTARGNATLQYHVDYDSSTIGADDYKAGVTYYFNGSIDLPTIYNRALSSSEIALLYREPFCMFKREPIELWSAATLGAPPVGNPGMMTTNTGYWGATY